MRLIVGSSTVERAKETYLVSLNVSCEFATKCLSAYRSNVVAAALSALHWQNDFD
jgi:hypothetical protein